MAVNKVIFNGDTLIDVSGDTITAAKLLSGYSAHDRSGAVITGACTFDADTGDATATAAEILTGKSAYVSGAKINGSMPNKGAVTGTISTKAGQYSIPAGFHDGSGKVGIASAEQAKIIAGNIKNGVEILGVTGTCEPSSDVTAQSKTVTPTSAAQTVLPDAGTDYLSQVTVNAIPYSETDNASGGKTVTIGA